MLSALVGIPLLVAAVWFGGLFLLAVVAALMFLGAGEFSRMFKGISIRAPLFLMIPGCFILLVLTYLHREGYPGQAVVTILALCLLAVVLLYPRFNPVDAAVTFTGILYVGLILYVFLLGTLNNGLIWLIFLLVCTWSSDTGAYLVGRKWGKRKMAPSLSPGKTVEGAAGGVLGSLLAAALVTVFYRELPVPPVLALGVLVGVAAQTGDLVESALKRQTGVKDTGRLIPGHGGVLDRFDSMLFTAPLVYYYVGLIIIS